MAGQGRRGKSGGTSGSGTGTGAALHLVKLCVGTESIEELRAWQSGRMAERLAAGLDPHPRHVTRMWPRRAEEILRGGSLYWVIHGVIRVRQRILGFEEAVGADHVRRCAIILDPTLVPVQPRPRAAFQGWRYLRAADAPPDLAALPADEAEMPPGMREALEELGVLGS